MELQYYGANTIKITTKKSTIVIDPVSDITKTSVDLKKVDTILATKPQFAGTNGAGFVIDRPGEYEFEDYSVKGIAAQPHDAASGDLSATMYWLSVNETRILVTGHIFEKLSEQQLEAIGTVDILVIPVGGAGYTLDGAGAAAVVREVEPKLVIPVHLADDKLTYEIPQQSSEAFIKELGAPVAEEQTDKLKVKLLPEQLTVQLLSRA